MWRRYKGRCLPACNAIGEGFEDGSRAVGFGRLFQSPKVFRNTVLIIYPPIGVLGVQRAGPLLLPWVLQ